VRTYFVGPKYRQTIIVFINCGFAPPPGSSCLARASRTQHSDTGLTVKTYAHNRRQDLARVVESLPTSALWASDP
jgi:hypothetical protein